MDGIHMDGIHMGCMNVCLLYVQRLELIEVHAKQHQEATDPMHSSIHMHYMFR